MAIGDVRQGSFTRLHSDGAATIASLIGGGNYSILEIRPGGRILIGDNAIDNAGYQLNANERFHLENGGNTTVNLIDGAKLHVRAAEAGRAVTIDIFAIDNA
jgi:hypothetical protein